MKLIFIYFLLGITPSGFSRNSGVFTLVAQNFKLLNEDKTTNVNKTISLTYNEHYASFTVQGKGTTSFPCSNYSNDLQEEGWYKESFYSEATDVARYGNCSVQIFRMKDENIFEIAVMNGGTYYAEHATLFSEDGQVLHNAIVSNWKEVLEKQKQEKEKLIKDNEATKSEHSYTPSIDYIAMGKADSIGKIEKEIALQSGETRIFIDKKTEVRLNEVVSKLVKLKKGDFLYSSWVIKISKEGIITDAFPDVKYKGGHIVDFYISEINKSLINQKVSPFIAYNGKYYPCFSTTYINLSPHISSNSFGGFLRIIK